MVFETGKVIMTSYGEPITIDSYIAGGGQGDVYKVFYAGEKKALKWYKPGALKDPDAFYENLKKNTEKGSPDKAFLWPEAVTEKKDGSFGYIMNLRPDGYNELTNVLVTSGGGGFTSFKAVVEAAIKIVSAFRILHVRGYSYQDMNSGNFFINPRTGDVLICDNDNVAPNGTYTGIVGTPQYMAPEIVMGNAKPDTHTDEFSLAVVLFMLLCASHPLEGEHWVVPCLTPEIEKRLYGNDALFIFDPHDPSNRPVRGVHNNVLKRWDFLPQYMKDAFLEAFSREAITNPNKRVRELNWLKALVRFQSDIVRCSTCGNEIFITNASSTVCDRCNEMYEVKNTLKLYEYSVTAAKNTRIYKCQLGVCNADEALTPVGLVVAKPDNPQVLGFRTLSKTIMIGTTPSGKVNQVQPGEVIPLKAGISIQVFDGTIEIQ